jgi:Ca2+-dependent lipid-binding protein
LTENKEVLMIRLEDIPALKKRVVVQVAVAIFGIVISMWFLAVYRFGLFNLLFTFLSLYYMYWLYRSYGTWSNLLKYERVLKKETIKNSQQKYQRWRKT